MQHFFATIVLHNQHYQIALHVIIYSRNYFAIVQIIQTLIKISVPFRTKMDYQKILIAILPLVDQARRIPENIVLLRRLNYVRAVKNCIQSKFRTDFVIAAIITCSAVMEDHEADMVRLDTSEYMSVNTLGL